MYAHFNAWRAVDDMAYDKGNDKIYPAWIMEADAYVDENQMKPRMTQPKTQPKDYDFLMMKRALFRDLLQIDGLKTQTVGEFHSFRRTGTESRTSSRWVRTKPVFLLLAFGCSGRRLTPSCRATSGPDFSYKAFNFISRKGADMIEWFLIR